jgi:DNA-binding LytR/AlgR family response regulator
MAGVHLMDTPSMTVEQIEDQIGAARERLAVLDQEAQSLALPAVEGDEAAAASLARINSEIRQITADVAVLDRARITVAQQQRKASEAEVTAYHLRHFEIAQDHAAVLVKLASRADELVAEFKAVFADMSATEREIWKALHEASAPPSDAVVGRKSLGQFAIAALTAFTTGADRFGQTRAVADIAATAWAFLLSKEADQDD